MPLENPEEVPTQIRTHEAAAVTHMKVNTTYEEFNVDEHIAALTRYKKVLGV